jgi:hypothetical protein
MTTRAAQVMFGLATAASRVRPQRRGLSRPQSDRIVLRPGCQIDTTRPDYRELDEALAGGAS